MLQTIFREKALLVLAALENTRALSGLLDQLDMRYMEVDALLSEIAVASQPNKFAELAAGISSQLKSVAAITRPLNARDLFKEMEAFSDDLSRIFEQDENLKLNCQSVSEQVDSFANRYSTFVSHQSAKNAFLLLKDARKTKTVLDVFRGMLQYIKASTTTEVEVQQDESELVVFLESVDFPHFRGHHRLAF